MAWARVAVVNERWEPLESLEVECYNLDTGATLAVVSTDLGGTAIFTGLPDTARFFFRARTTRVRTKVGQSTFTGEVRVQILASSALCVDAMVDPSGQWGTHTTIQAAIDSFAAGARGVIGVLPGTYAENLVIPATGAGAAELTFISCGKILTTLGSIAGSNEASGARVLVNGGTGIALTYASLVIGQPVVFQNFEFTSSSSVATLDLNRGYVRRLECIVRNTGSGLPIDLSTDTFTVENCFIKAASTASYAVEGGGSSPRFINTKFVGRIKATGAGSVLLDTCTVTAAPTAGNGAVEFDSGLTLSADYRILGCHITISTAGDAIRLGSGGAVGSRFAWIVNDNEIFGDGSGSSGTAIEVDNSCKAIVDGNAIKGFATGINIESGAICVVGPNLTNDVTTPVAGTPTAGTGAHNLLDGIIHGDTVTQGVSVGSLIYGNATPAWDELVIAVPAANVRNVLGVDNGETVPSWKTALDATNPADIAAAASPGTSLIFSHRDHVHAHPSLGADLHHAGFIGFIIAGPANIDPDVGDRITFVDTATVTWTSPAAGQISATAAGGGAHNLLSATHSDTVVQAVSRGSLIYGDATPAWNELVVGAAGSGLWTDGIDASWTTSPRYAGYLRVGSDAVPANTTAGDLTALRLAIPDVAFSGDTPARLVYISDTYTASSSFPRNTAFITTTVTSGIPLNARALFVQLSVIPTAAILGGGSAGTFVARHDAGSFDVGSLLGLQSTAIQNVAGTTVTALTGLSFLYQVLAGTVTTAIGLDIIRGDAGDAGAIGTGIGLRIGASAGVTPTTDIAIQSLGGHNRFIGGLSLGANATR